MFDGGDGSVGIFVALPWVVGSIDVLVCPANQLSFMKGEQEQVYMSTC